ncbi:MAG: hypothetical protein ABI560_04475, partial [Myxococcales bacterium]
MAVLVFAFAGPVRAADLFPYFKPDPAGLVEIPIANGEAPREYTAARAHPVATECPVDDGSCIARHDRNALDLALLTAEPSSCDRSTRPASCTDSYRMITGDTDPAPRWSGLADPCTIVVRVDAGIATLYNPRTAQTRPVPDAGWHAGGYVGACDIASLNLRTGTSIESLPRFPW